MDNTDILIVDDEADIRDLIAGILEDEGYQTRCASNGIEALDSIANKQPSLVILDVWLGNGQRDGLEILETIKRNHPFVPVIMISGHGTVETAVKSIKNGAYDFIEKPFTTQRLLLLVQRAMESFLLRYENEEFKKKSYNQNELIGSSPVIKQARQLVNDASISKGRILISGPFGSGRETIAHAIHAKSSRSKRPFFSMNCSSIHPMQIEAELFGTQIEGLPKETPRKIGIFEKASDATLYIANIESLPLSIQQCLTKVLQNNGFYRLGGQSFLKTNARIIASCNKDPKQLIADGKLLADLFYRLSAVHISLPPLKDRIVDIPELVEHFVKQITNANRIMAPKIPNETLAALQSYNWPGNLQQLRNTMERILIINASTQNNPIITPEMLPTDITKKESLTINHTDETSEIILLPLREAREAFERNYLCLQMQRFGGNISKTASFIGMERSALHRKLKGLRMNLSSNESIQETSTHPLD
jgi:two-component system nitrogen regulation response regulator NtrX